MTTHDVNDENLSYGNLVDMNSDLQIEIARLKLAHHRMCQDYYKLEEERDATEKTCEGLAYQLEKAQTLIDAISKSNDIERANSFSLQRENLKLHRRSEYYEEITKAYCFFTECSVALDDILDSHEDDYSNDDHVQTARDRLILLFHMTLKSIIDGSSQTEYAQSSIDPIDTASFRPPGKVDDIPF